MSILKIFIRALSTQEARVLGRWKLENSILTINNKVDLANEDHCGVCSEYRIMKSNHINEIPLTQEPEPSEEEEYLRYMM